MNIVDEFAAIFGVWEPAQPYLSLIVDVQEMALIVGMAGQPVTAVKAADILDTSPEDAAQFLERCYQRCLVNKSIKDGLTYYRATDFGTRLDHFAKYENWDDIPAEARTLINRCFLDEFIAKHRPNVERKMRGLAAENGLPNDTVMLLHEVEAMIDAAECIIVQPCDCRRLGQNCHRPVETCIWLDEGARAALDRGHGRSLTKAEAKAIVRRADKRGLMHTADSEWQTRGLHAICNCCADDCYPFRAAQELGSKGVWPKSRYVAVHDRAQCTLCGACVKRCHFDAFYLGPTRVEREGKLKPDILFDAAKCWGCGLCANICPATAIVMQKLA